MVEKISDIPWSEEALFNKAQIYAEEMESYAADEWQYGLWSTFVLELLARAALAHTSPVLLADASNWRNITYALGQAPTAKRFNPVSIPVTEVILRLEELIPDITKEISGICSRHLQRRNAELHSGELIFSELGTSKWLPNFYLASKALLAVMNKDLDDIFANAESAVSMIEAMEDQAAKAVEQDIKAHRQVWNNKPKEEKELSLGQATNWATRHGGHRVDCPACGSPALLQGSPSGTVSTEVDETTGEVIQRQTMLPTYFECVACGLKIAGLSKLSACDLGDAFTAKSVFPAAEFFELYSEEDLEEARAEGRLVYEEDFND